MKTEKKDIFTIGKIDSQESINNDVKEVIDELTSQSEEDTREEQIEDIIGEVDIHFVIDSACDGALNEITRQLDKLDCPKEIYDEVRDEIFKNRIIIDA